MQKQADTKHVIRNSVYAHTFYQYSSYRESWLKLVHKPSHSEILILNVIGLGETYPNHTLEVINFKGFNPQ